MVMTEPSWLIPPENIEYTDEVVDVWRCRIDEVLESEWGHLRLLSTEERQRAERFRLETTRRQFVIARAALRTVLGRYLDIAPEDLRFAYTAMGKPVLVNDDSTHISFNLSHSENVCLITVTRDCRVGIDVEKIQSNLDYVELGSQIFSGEEMAKFRTLDSHLRPNAFLKSWTRKEAYLKAIGEGLATGDKAGLPDEGRWTILNFLPDVNYVAAVAVERVGVRFNHWTLFSSVR
jgi:4'-phosphopantetheinyl transferase